MTQNGQIIISTSHNLWEMYKESHRLMNYGVVIVTNSEVTDIAKFQEWLLAGGIPQWSGLMSDFGLATEEQAEELFFLMIKTFSQINADDINGETNYLRQFMHRIG